MRCDLCLLRYLGTLVVSWAGQTEVEGVRHEGFIAQLICQVRGDLDDDAAYKEKEKEKRKNQLRHYGGIDQLHTLWDEE